MFLLQAHIRTAHRLHLPSTSGREHRSRKIKYVIWQLNWFGANFWELSKLNMYKVYWMIPRNGKRANARMMKTLALYRWINITGSLGRPSLIQTLSRYSCVPNPSSYHMFSIFDPNIYFLWEWFQWLIHCAAQAVEWDAFGIHSLVSQFIKCTYIEIPYIYIYAIY